MEQASQGEPRDQLDRGQGTIDEVFLTPRIVDQHAFEEYSATLRELIESASEQGSTLESAALSARDTSVGVEKIAAALNSRLSSAQQVLPALDERLTRIEKLLETAVDAAKVSERVASEVDEQLDRTLEERLGVVEKRVAEVAIRLERRLDDIESRSSKAVELAERTVIGQADKLESLLKQAERSIPDLEKRSLAAVQQADERLGGVGEAIEKRVAEIKRELASMTGPAVTSLNLLCKRAQEMIGRDPRLGGDSPETPPFAEGSLGAMLERAASVASDAEAGDARLTELRGLAEQAKAELFEAIQGVAERAAALNAQQDPIDDRITAARSACVEIEAFLAQHEKVLERAAKLPTGDDIKKAEQQARTIKKALGDVASAQESLAELGTSAKAERKTLDQISARARRVGKSVQETEAKLSSVESLAASQLAKVEGVLDEPVAELDKQVREAGAWLTQMVEQARAAQTSMAEAYAQVDEAEQRVGAIIARLEPWRDVLGRAPGDGLPEGVAEMISQVRSRVSDELDRAEGVLVSLREAASRAAGSKPEGASESKPSEPLPPPPLNPIRFKRTDQTD